VAIAAGVSRFLAVESCGQCTPCKQDGRAIAAQLARVAASDATDDDLETIDQLLGTVTDSARCNLAYQQHDVVDSVLSLFLDQFQGHVTETVAAVEPARIAAILDLVDGRAVLDEHQRAKQPDWTYDAEDSGQSPADRLDDHRAHETL
jgi:hypothetical protein